MLGSPRPSSNKRKGGSSHRHVEIQHPIKGPEGKSSEALHGPAKPTSSKGGILLRHSSSGCRQLGTPPGKMPTARAPGREWKDQPCGKGKDAFRTWNPLVKAPHLELFAHL